MPRGGAQTSGTVYFIRNGLIAFAAQAFVLWSGPGIAADIEVLYQDRPPYYLTNEDGSPGGLVAGPVAEALAAAGIDAHWSDRPSKRQMEAVKANRTAVCSPGWFKKPEREEFAKFSDVVYQDLPQVVVTNRNGASVSDFGTLASLFADREMMFGTKLGYSYGPFVDGLRDQFSPNVVTTAQDNSGMIRMLLGRRFDYMIAAPEEVESLSRTFGDRATEIVSNRMSDVPPGNKRYLMCSKKVSDDILRRFNKALADLK